MFLNNADASRRLSRPLEIAPSLAPIRDHLPLISVFSGGNGRVLRDGLASPL